MIPELDLVLQGIRRLRARLSVARAEPEAGYSTEAVVVIALLVMMAVTAVAIISAKVIAKANDVDTGP